MIGTNYIMEFEVKNDLSRVANILGNLDDSTGLARSHLKNQSDDDSGWDTDLECEDETTSDAFDVVQVNKEKYVKACKECGVVPASYFLRNMTNVRLNMSHHGLGHKGAKAIAIGLMTNTHLTALDLSDNCLGSEGVSCICEMMIENCFISELDLSENNIGYEGVKHICALLMQSDSLKRLALRKNSLETKSAVILSNTLKSHTGLRFIDLSNNNFGEEAGLHFAPVISTNEYLEEINLSWNHLRQKGAFAIAKSLKENYTLKKLDLSWNGFGDDGIYVLSDSLIQNNSLQQLNLSSNRITHIGAGHLQKALKENEGLQVFKLGHNPLQHGVTFLIQGIKTNLNSTLVEFDLTDVQVNDEFITILNQLKTERTELQVYHGGLGGAPQKAAERPKPMRVLRDYIKNNQMRVFDLFKSLDKDKSMSISVPEFVAGLKETGVPLRIDELLTLVKSLDLDGDGEIDYREMVIGQQEMQKEEREEIIRDKADRKRKKTLAQGLKPSTPSTGVRIRKSSPNPRFSPLRSPAHSRPTSPVSPRVMSPVLQRRRSRTFTPGYDDTPKDQKSNELLIPPSTTPGRKSPAQEI